MTTRPAYPVRAHLLLRDGDRLLLTLRARQLPSGGLWQLPGGHLEPGETLTACAVREACEETGLVVDRDACFVHTAQVLTTAGLTRIAVFFLAARWLGEPVIGEPAECDGLGWYPLNGLPRPMVPYIARAIGCYIRGEPFSVTMPPGRSARSGTGFLTAGGPVA